jgi:uncharacterized protein YndB with AHSA1/START domain
MKNRNQLIITATTKVFLLCFIALSITGCYSVKKSVEQSYPNSKEIRWPADYKPEESNFFVHNEIDINASPETVWSVLIQADEWEDYYEGASDLKLLNNSDGRLSDNSVFTWKTMGLDFTSTIKEFEAPHKLSWESDKKSIRGYHAWLIIPTENGCKLITSEAQHGFMTFLQKVFVPNKLEGFHDEWLAQIKVKSENIEK